MAAMPRPSRTAFWLATGAVAWAAAFTALALTASFYEPGGETILEVNEELAVRVALAAPLLVSVLVWLALHIACRTDSQALRRLGIVTACLLVAFSLVTGFTIGTFVLPGAVALVAGALLTPVGSRLELR
jgi:hypothetical protein